MGAAVRSNTRPEKIFAARASGHIARVERMLHGAQNLRVARRLHQRFAQSYAAGQQTFHALVSPQDSAICRHRNYRLLHGVQQRLQGLAAVLQGAESVLQLARRLVERGGHVRDFIGRVFLDSGREIARCHPLGKLGNSAEPSSQRLGCKKREHMAIRTATAELLISALRTWRSACCSTVRGYAMRTAPPGTGSRDIEKRDAQRVAVANVAA